MTECNFCEEEFDSDRKLHLHWANEHREELNSHQEEKVKKAERKQEEEKQEKMAERKRMAGYGLAGLAALAVLGFVVSQIGLEGGNNTQGSSEINLEGEPMIGNPNASVTVVEFGDYRCPVCKQFHAQVYPQLKKDYIDTGKIKFHFVSYSFLDQGFPGDTSTTASVASECVYNQDEEQFWNFHNALYNNQGPEREDWATEDFVLSLARNKTSGLDYEELEACVSNRDTLDRVRQEREKGQNAGVQGTPAIYVNGKYLNNWQYGALKAEIEKQLDQ